MLREGKKLLRESIIIGLGGAFCGILTGKFYVAVGAWMIGLVLFSILLELRKRRARRELQEKCLLDATGCWKGKAEWINKIRKHGGK